MKKQFDSMCSDFEPNLVYVKSKNLWISFEGAKWDIDILSTHKSCKSLRAFRRHLKHISKNQPELVGTEFILQNKYYGFTKSGKRKSYDITMRVK